MTPSDTVAAHEAITRIRTRVGAEAARLGLPVPVMHTHHRPPGHAHRWASPPTPRAAIAYLTTIDPDRAATQIVRDWCDAQLALGHTVTDADRAALDRAARPDPNPR